MSFFATFSKTLACWRVWTYIFLRPKCCHCSFDVYDRKWILALDSCLFLHFSKVFMKNSLINSSNYVQDIFILLTSGLLNVLTMAPTLVGPGSCGHPVGRSLIYLLLNRQKQTCPSSAKGRAPPQAMNSMFCKRCGVGQISKQYRVGLLDPDLPKKDNLF